MDNPLNAEAVLTFTQRRHITLLFKSFITTLENITHDHDECMLKLRAALPKDHRQYVELADYLSEDRYQRYRKAILDAGNDTLRTLEEEIKKFKVDFKL